VSYALHPLAALIPEMTADQFAELRADIEQRGLMHPIVLHEHMVLDGRHRLRACEETGVEPRFEDFNGPSPVEFVISVNVKRRHLTETQLAVIGMKFLPAAEAEAKARQRQHGGTAPGRPAAHSGSVDPECAAPEPRRAREDVGRMVGVSGVTIDRVRRVSEQAPDLMERVEAGEISVRAADSALRDRNGTQRGPQAPVSPDFAVTSGRDQIRAEANKRKVIDLVSTLSGFARGLDGIDVNRARAVMDEAELREWDRSLSDSLSKLRGFRSDLQKGRP